MKMQFIIYFLTAITLFGCGSGEEDLKEQTVIQSQEEINAQNKNIEEWSEKLSADLQSRRTFIDAVEGEYEGEFQVNDSTFKLRLVVAPTIPAYDVDRTKTLAELEYELQNLNLNIQTVQWNPNSKMSAVGCVIENVRPDLKRGILNLISESCGNTYELFLAEDEALDKNLKSKSIEMASWIKAGKVKFVQALNGKLRSSSNAATYKFSLSRM